MAKEKKTPLVLVVDDNELNREMTGCVLDELGALIDEAESGQKAIELASVNKYDAILMDYMMPEMDGAEATRNIRMINGCEEIPVIAMTAEEDPKIVQTLLASGMNAILHKPLDQMALYGTLSEYVSGKLNMPNGSVLPKDEESEEITSIKKLGFDTDAGIRFTGSLSHYMNYLHDMIRLLPEILATLNKSEETGDFERFTIEVHGLKSNFRALGNKDLFIRSQELEKLGKEREYDDIKKKYPAFYTDCQECLEGLRSLISPEVLLPALSLKSVKRVMRELRDACDTFDLDTADYIHDRLKAHEPIKNLKELFDRLYGEIAGVRYDGAIEVIDEIIAKCTEKADE